MRVLFDGYWWVRGPVSNRQVQREIVRHWIDAFPDDDAVLVLRHADADAADLPPRTTVRTTRLWPHGLASIAHYPWLARRVGADVIVTHNFTPWSQPSAVFVHDVMFQTSPEWFTRAERAYFWPIPRLLPRADVVATSSRHEAERIAARNPRVRRAVEAIGLAVGTELAHADPARPEGVAADERYVLSVGRLNVRKNLGRTFDGALASGAVSPTRPLLVVGEPEGVRTEVDPSVRRAIDDGTVRFLGRVDDANLAWLYAHAELFVFLSLDEGFGLPPLEALSFGCPVLASDIPVLRETLGPHARYVDPLDVSAIARAMAELADAPERVVPPALPQWDDTVRRLRSAVLAAVRPQLP
ncbi:MAG: glycosyltransferase family 1 protein [Acidimicrobiales bacterium]